ncbi:outer membrane protein [Leptospira weilii serovar Ranarum str. ICFT]|uniref:Outer membrane protein n=1 Tax=Leptospira weilii serovar Ranarum str. ICFT TaxID=1218598 RepID=N1WQW2_9LEPT|nr:outer membrane beta-barrel protein [Leptospira weilii]EMY78223.1 outer membrane protein [Leptospira weilii serovar Ranarum str. ICFT]
MRIKTITLVASVLCWFASSQVFAQTGKKPAADASVVPAPVSQTAEQEDKKWYDQVEFSGFADVYYMYNLNPKQGSDVDATRAFETSNKNFAVNAVALTIQKAAEKSSPWGFRIDIQNGQNNAFQEAPYSQSNSIYNYNMLKQGYVSLYFPVLKGMTLDVGKMATHIGYEVLESMSNPNYSIGAIFQNTIPFIHTGARLTTQFTDKWAGTFYIYNSGGGTGYNSPATTTTAPLNVITDPAYSGNAAGKSYFVEGQTERKAIGTQLKGQLIEDKLSITWNTLYSADGAYARVDPSKAAMATELANSSGDSKIGLYNVANPQRAKYNKDYWFMNHAILSITPTDKITIDLDYTWSEKAGGAVTNGSLDQRKYNVDGTGAEVFNKDTLFLGLNNKRDIKTTYKAYAIFAKFKINEAWGVNVRAEYIDDKHNNGALTTFNPFMGPNAYVGEFKKTSDVAIADAVATALAADPTFGSFGVTKEQILEAMSDDYKNYGGTRNAGQYKTFTVTPVWNFTENLLIKLDLRRDWATGKQFVNQSGEKSDHQNGLTLGVVAKF